MSSYLEFLQQDPHSCVIKSLNNPHAYLAISSMPAHDMLLQTCDDQAMHMGPAVRVYNYSGSPRFGTLHAQFSSAYKYTTSINQVTYSNSVFAPSKTKKVHLTDPNKTVMTMTKSESGLLYIQTSHLTEAYGESSGEPGPAILLCAPIHPKSTRAEKQRAKIFLPAFDMLEKLAPQFNAYNF